MTALVSVVLVSFSGASAFAGDADLSRIHGGEVSVDRRTERSSGKLRNLRKVIEDAHCDEDLYTRRRLRKWIGATVVS